MWSAVETGGRRVPVSPLSPAEADRSRWGPSAACGTTTVSGSASNAGDVS
jgi:hypothetical protein